MGVNRFRYELVLFITVVRLGYDRVASCALLEAGTDPDGPSDWKTYLELPLHIGVERKVFQ